MTDEDTGPTPVLLTAQQVADRFGVSVRAVNRWAREGRLAPAMVTLGGHYRFTPEAVDAAAAAALATKTPGEG